MTNTDSDNAKVSGEAEKRIPGALPSCAGTPTRSHFMNPTWICPFGHENNGLIKAVVKCSTCLRSFQLERTEFVSGGDVALENDSRQQRRLMTEQQKSTSDTSPEANNLDEIARRARIELDRLDSENLIEDVESIIRRACEEAIARAEGYSSLLRSETIADLRRQLDEATTVGWRDYYAEFEAMRRQLDEAQKALECLQLSIMDLSHPNCKDLLNRAQQAEAKLGECHDLIIEIADESAIEFKDERLRYHVVQMTTVTWERLQESRGAIGAARAKSK